MPYRISSVSKRIHRTETRELRFSSGKRDFVLVFDLDLDLDEPSFPEIRRLVEVFYEDVGTSESGPKLSESFETVPVRELDDGEEMVVSMTLVELWQLTSSQEEVSGSENETTPEVLSEMLDEAFESLVEILL